MHFCLTDGCILGGVGGVWGRGRGEVRGLLQTLLLHPWSLCCRHQSTESVISD